MKLSELVKNYSTQRVIMYNKDQTKALYKNRKISQIDGCIWIGEPIYDNYGNESFDVFFKFCSAKPAMWINAYSGRCEVSALLESVDEVKNATSLISFVDTMTQKISEKKHIRMTEILMLKNINEKLAEDAAKAEEEFKAEHQRKHDEKMAQDAQEAAQRNEESKREVEAAKAVILSGTGEIRNEVIIFYGEHTWERETCKMVEYLMREYGVELSPATKGWIRDRLTSIDFDGNRVTWHFLSNAKRKGGSGAFGDALTKLVMKVKEDAKCA